MKNKFYVYIKRNAITMDIVYVGKGSGSRYKTNQGRTKFYLNYERKYGLINEFVETNMSEEQSFELERFLIQELGRRDLKTGKLLNLTDGGEGTSNPSLKTRKKLSENSKGNKHSLGRVLPEWEKKIRSESMIGLKRTEENKKKCAISKIGSKNPNFDPTIHKWVNEFSGEVVFATCNEMKNKYSPKSRTKFSNLAKGKTKSLSVKGWFLNEVKERIKNGVTTGKDHHLYKPIKSLTNGMIFETQQQAAKFVGLTSSSKISMCLNGKRNSAGGHQWAFVA